MKHRDASGTRSIDQIAAEAFAAGRRAQAAAILARDHLPEDIRLAVEEYLAATGERLFDPEALLAASALQVKLAEVVEQLGGAPTLRHTEEGQPYTVGGTGPGRCVHTLVQRLAQLLQLAWQVSDRLAAEAALAARRMQHPGRGCGGVSAAA